MIKKKMSGAKRKSIIAGLLFVIAGLALAADGDLDTTFNSGGANPGAVNVSFSTGTATAALSSGRQQADNTFLVAGVENTQNNNGPDVYISTLSSAGTVTGTPVTVDMSTLMAGGVDTVSVPADGAVFVTGQGLTNTGTLVQAVVAKLNSAGTVLASYVRPNGVNNESGGGDNVIVEANGKISSFIIVGSRNATSGNRVGVLRLNSDLTADNTFGSGGTALLAVGAYPTNYVSAEGGDGGITVIEDGSGNYYVLSRAGKNYTTGANPKAQDQIIFVAKFDSSGNPVNAFGGANNGIATLPVSSSNCSNNCNSVSPRGIAFDASGNLVVAGRMPDPSNASNGIGFLARLNPSTGALDQSFGTAGTGIIQEKFVTNSGSQPNSILVTASGIYYLTYSNLYRLNGSSGAVDQSFNSASTNVNTLNNNPSVSGTQASNWNGIVQLDANNALVLGGVSSCVGVNQCGPGTIVSPNQAVVAKVRLVTDTTPDAFSFPAVTNQQLNTTATSISVKITGINSAAPIGVSGTAGSAFSINGAAFTSIATTINNGDSVVVHHTTSGSPNATVSTTLNIGGVTGTFSSTTVPPDTTPNPYSFAAKTNQAVNTPIVSAPATITGINTAAPISISGGTNPGYSVGCTGTFRSDASTINNNQTVCVQVTSANAPNTSTSTTLNVGGVTASFQVTTANGPVVSLSPTSLSFGSHPTGTTTAAQTVTLTNNGTATLNISTIMMAGDYAMANTSTCANGGTVASGGGSCKIDVTFSPTTTGARPGSITINSNASTSPDSVALSGTGTGPVPAVSLNPTSLNFPGQNVGTTSSPMSSTLTNTGSASLTITSIAASAHYAVATGNNSCPTGTPIAVNATCTINVTYSPAASTANGADTGNVTILSNDPNSPTFLTLSGTGLAPTVGLSPNPRTFPDTNVGSTSAAQTITLSNSGNGTLNISSIGVSPAEYNKASSTCGATLASGSSCAINITFTPAAAGSRPGTATVVTTNASPLQYNVTLSGNGTTPATATLSPTTLNFAAQNVGSTSAPQTIKLTNSGTLTLNNIVIAHTGDYATPAAATNPCGATLAGGANCNISVTFTPAATGPRNGTVTVTSSAGTSGATLSGAGTTPPTATLAPTTLTFSGRLVGSTSAPQTITLTNSGTLPLNNIVVAHTGDYATPAAATNPCGTTLAGGANCNISVTFTPAGTGTRTGTVTVSSNAPAGNSVANLSGTGVAPAVTLSPTSLSFTSQATGTTSAAKTSTLTNSGTAPLTITSIAASGDFGQTNTCGASLAAGANCTISVTFAPTVSGTRTGSVTVTTSAGSSPDTVSLTGTAVSSATVNTPAGQVTLTSSLGQITSFTNTATVPAGVPAGYTFPLGFFNYTVTGLPATGAPATVTFVFTLPAGVSTDSYMKCTAAACAPFAGATISGNTLTLTITDNGTGDSNNAQGTIVDPGAPAVAPAAADNGGGAMEWMSLLLLGLPGLFRRRQRVS